MSASRTFACGDGRDATGRTDKSLAQADAGNRRYWYVDLPTYRYSAASRPAWENSWIETRQWMRSCSGG
jgi:hypothetical protein